jgi:hypothetical protein
VPVPPPVVVLVVLGPPVTLVVDSSGPVPDAPDAPPQPPITRAMTRTNAIASGCLGLSFMAPTSPYPPGAMVRLDWLWVNVNFVTVIR